jgi:hypothetical protein
MSDKECDTRKIKEESEILRRSGKREIFMISPFGFPYDDIWNHGIKKIINNYDPNILVTRADTSLALGYIMCLRICQRIKLADYIIADITEDNPNVYYEIGLSLGFGKKIIFIRNKNHKSRYSIFFDGIYKDSILEYNGFESFSEYNRNNYSEMKTNINKILDNDFMTNLFGNNESDQLSFSVYRKCDYDKIMYIGNGQNTMPGLHTHALQDAKYKKLRNQNIIIDGIVLKEESLLSETINGIKNEQELNGKTNSTKICVIDISNYGNINNPLLYFCLGFAHSMERDVIPIINPEYKKEIVFDIGGLYHIYYKDKKDLQGEFEHILPKVYNDFKAKQKDYPYKIFWNHFLFKETALKLLTCARNQNDKERGERTYIDKWDYKSVSDLHFFIPQLFQYVEVHSEELESKKTVNDFLVNGTDIKTLEKKYANKPINYDSLNILDANKIELIKKSCEEKLVQFDSCIIIGSPDINDYAEISLSKIHGVLPYKKNSNPPFMFSKVTFGVFHPRRISSFYKDYIENKTNISADKNYGYIEWYKNEGGKTFASYENEKGRVCQTFGVLTIAKNPYAKNRHSYLMIISGFTGIATYGIMQILINEKKYKEQFNKIVENNLYKDILDINILIQINYSNPTFKNINEGLGDLRSINEENGIEVIDIRQTH